MSGVIERFRVEVAKLTDEIRRRDEIIESNKTLASDLIDALSRVDAGVFCINNLDFQLAAAINRVKELEGGLKLFVEVVPKLGEDYEPAYQHGIYITIGDLRRAAELLKDATP